MCVCVCVCVRARARVYSTYFGDSSSDQGETCASLCRVFRGLNFPAYCSVPLNQPASHRRGQPLGLFLFSFSQMSFSLMPHRLLPCLAPFFIARRVQSPLPSSTMTSNFVNSRSFSAFYSFRPPATEVRQNPLSPRFEPVNWLLQGCVDTN